MRITKASDADIQELKKYLQKNELNNAKNFPIGWRRVIFGYVTMRDYLCTDDGHLELKPHLKEADDAFKKKNP